MDSDQEIYLNMGIDSPERGEKNTMKLSGSRCGTFWKYYRFFWTGVEPHRRKVLIIRRRWLPACLPLFYRTIHVEGRQESFMRSHI